MKQPRSKYRSRFKKPGWAFSIGAMVVGLAGIVVTWISVGENFDTSSWIKTSGVIDSVEMKESTAQEHGATVYKYQILLSYTYDCGQGSCTGSRISRSGKGWMRSHEAKGLIEEKQWHKSNAVDVYYTPDNPAEAVLLIDSEGASQNDWIALGFFVFLFAAGAVILVRDKLPALRRKA